MFAPSLFVSQMDNLIDDLRTAAMGLHLQPFSVLSGRRRDDRLRYSAAVLSVVFAENVTVARQQGKVCLSILNAIL